MIAPVWTSNLPDLNTANPLAEALGVPPFIAQCLVQRGLTTFETASRFLEPKLKHLSDPFLLPDMKAAVDRIVKARVAGEGIVVFGDYDVDGVCATALLLELLRHFGLKVQAHLPDRFDEGYGLGAEAVDKCLEQHDARILIAVDCGSSSAALIEGLQNRGVDVIVLDHHQLGSPAPRPLALVNPQAVGPQYAGLNAFCSGGLAFKFAHALAKTARELGWPEAPAMDVRVFLDLAALATIADLAPLQLENRILTSAGLARLTETRRPGLVALKQVAGVEGAVGTGQVAFALGPRLNAAGRVDNAEAALRLVLAASETEALPLATELDQQNRQRQQIEREIVEPLIASLRGRFDPSRDFVIVEGDPRWHIGVVGIVAARVMREFYRPTIILGGDGELWRGSGRSIEGFDLAAALRETSGHLKRHGGHAMAAGISIEPERLSAFRDDLNKLARARITTEQLFPKLRVDAWVGLGEVGMTALEALKRLEPFGMGNPAIHLAARGLSVGGRLRRMGQDGKHASFQVTDGVARLDAVWWNAPVENPLGGVFDLAFVPELDDYRGTGVRLKVLDCRASVPAKGVSK